MLSPSLPSSILFVISSSFQAFKHFKASSSYMKSIYSKILDQKNQMAASYSQNIYEKCTAIISCDIQKKITRDEFSLGSHTCTCQTHFELLRSIWKKTTISNCPLSRHNLNCPDTFFRHVSANSNQQSYGRIRLCNQVFGPFQFKHVLKRTLAICILSTLLLHGPWVTPLVQRSRRRA